MRFIPLFVFLSFFVQSQDSLYTRSVIKYLTSKKCYGRGYVKGGLAHASDYIVKEIKKNKGLPLFDKSYLQPYSFPVNTFPKKVEVSINGKKLIPGRDFIIDPECPSTKSNFEFIKKDSIRFVSTNTSNACIIKLSKKLTYSVGTSQKKNCQVEILRAAQTEDIKTAEISIDAKFIPKFKANNIGAYIEGQNNDSLMVFTAHYDHLGAMGKDCFFPGANDNASGTSVILNLIKYYSAHKPKYKTIFIFFSGEEAGLLGSQYFVEHPNIDLTKVKFLINLDLLGTGDDGIMVVNGAIYTKQFELLEKINKEKNLVKEIRKRGKARNSDHYWFSEKGVPSFFIYTLGGVSFYHDIDDVEKTLPLTDYIDVFQLMIEFASQL